MADQETQNFRLYVSEGDACYRMGLFSKAIDSYTAALDIRPDRNVLISRSRSYVSLGKSEEAIRDATEAIGNDGQFYSGCYQLGEAYYSAGMFEEALISYYRAYRRRPDIQDFRLGVQKAEESILRAVDTSVNIHGELVVDIDTHPTYQQLEVVYSTAEFPVYPEGYDGPVQREPVRCLCGCLYCNPLTCQDLAQGSYLGSAGPEGEEEAETSAKKGAQAGGEKKGMCRCHCSACAHHLAYKHNQLIDPRSGQLVSVDSVLADGEESEFTSRVGSPVVGPSTGAALLAQNPQIRDIASEASESGHFDLVDDEHVATIDGLADIGDANVQMLSSASVSPEPGSPTREGPAQEENAEAAHTKPSSPLVQQSAASRRSTKPQTPLQSPSKAPGSATKNSRPARRGTQARKPTGNLAEDKAFLQELQKDRVLRETCEGLNPVLANGIEYIDKRQEFWRQQGKTEASGDGRFIIQKGPAAGAQKAATRRAAKSGASKSGRGHPPQHLGNSGVLGRGDAQELSSIARGLNDVQELLHRGDMDGALSLARNLDARCSRVSINPSDAEASAAQARLQADIQTVIGCLLFDTGRGDASLPNFRKALALSSRVRDFYGTLRGARNLGRVMLVIGDTAASSASFNDVLSMARLHGEEPDRTDNICPELVRAEAHLFISKGALQGQQDQPDQPTPPEAREHIDLALGILLGREPFDLDAFEQDGMDLTPAIGSDDFAEFCAAAPSFFGNPEPTPAELVLDCFVVLAKCVYDSGDAERAERLFKAALEKARAANDLNSLVPILGTLSEIARARGDEDAAAAYLRELDEVNARLQSGERLEDVDYTGSQQDLGSNPGSASGDAGSASVSAREPTDPGVVGYVLDESVPSGAGSSIPSNTVDLPPVSDLAL